MEQEQMADTAANRPPLLLNSYCNEGLLVYNVHLESVSSPEPNEPPALEARLSPDPIARFLNEDYVIATAAVSGGAGGSILSLLRNYRDTAVLDIVTQASTPGPELREPKLLHPVMLPVGDDTVIVMDTILRGGDCCCFEALRRVPGGGWHTDPLPNPPLVAGHHQLPTIQAMVEEGCYDDNWYIHLPAISAYFVMGTRVWISIYTPGHDDIAGTYSLDTERGKWQKEGSWELPLQGQCLFVTDLGLVFAFSNLPLVGCSNYMKPRCHHLCALDVEAQPPVVRHMWEFPVERREEVPLWDTLSLAHLGNGRFCIARSVKVEQSAMISPWCNGRGTSFTLVDVNVTRSTELHQLRLTSCGRPHTHQWGWPYQHYDSTHFL